MPLLRLTCMVLLAGMCQTAAGADPGPDPRVKELKVLDQFAGTWSGTQPGTKRKVQVTSEWILEGRVLQTKLNLTDGREMLILRTYNSQLKQYVATIWDSRGMAIILSGDFDPKENMLTVSADAGRTRIKAGWKLTDENTEQWQIVFSDHNGKPQSTIAGTNQRAEQTP